MSGLTSAVLWSGKVNLRDTSSFLDVSKSGRPAALIFFNLYVFKAFKLV